MRPEKKGKIWAYIQWHNSSQSFCSNSKFLNCPLPKSGNVDFEQFWETLIWILVTIFYFWNCLILVFFKKGLFWAPLLFLEKSTLTLKKIVQISVLANLAKLTSCYLDPFWEAKRAIFDKFGIFKIHQIKGWSRIVSLYKLYRTPWDSINAYEKKG